MRNGCSMIRASISRSPRAASSPASITWASRSKARASWPRFTRACATPAAACSNRVRPPAATRSRRNRGSTTPPASRGRLSSPLARASTTVSASSRTPAWRAPRRAARRRPSDDPCGTVRHNELATRYQPVPAPETQHSRAVRRTSKGSRVVRLYMFEHCSLCFRVRMIAALKRLHLQETVVLDDDSETMIGLVGKRIVPILVKDDGQPMLESMDMVAYVDGLGERILTGPERSQVGAWSDRIVAKTAPLTMPRYPLLGLPEFGTIAALDHYTLRKRKALGDFVEQRIARHRQ